MDHFIYTIIGYLSSPELGYDVVLGETEKASTLAIKPIEGSESVHQYMDGSKDIRLSFEISIKTEKQEEGFNALHRLICHMKQINDKLQSKKQETKIYSVVTETIPSFEPRQATALYHCKTKLTVQLTEI